MLKEKDGTVANKIPIRYSDDSMVAMGAIPTAKKVQPVQTQLLARRNDKRSCIFVWALHIVLKVSRVFVVNRQEQSNRTKITKLP